MRSFKYLVAAAGLALTVGTANATTFDWSSICATCAETNGHGTIEATFEGGDEYLVTALIGTDGGAFGNLVLLPAGAFLGNDNLIFFPSSSPFDLSGLAHTFENNSEQVDWSCSSGNCEITYLGVDHSATFNISLEATPLPAALPLFVGGAGFIGVLARRRKRKVALAV